MWAGAVKELGIKAAAHASDSSPTKATMASTLRLPLEKVLGKLGESFLNLTGLPTINVG